jgi:hypothetical protein
MCDIAGADGLTAPEPEHMSLVLENTEHGLFEHHRMAGGITFGRPVGRVRVPLQEYRAAAAGGSQDLVFINGGKP